MAEKLSIIFDNDYFSINNLAFQSSEELEVNYPDEHSRFVLATIKIEQLNWFGTFNSNKDMPTETGSCVCDNIDLLAVSSAPATINLNLANKVQRIFKIADFGTDKEFALLSATLGLSIKIIFTLTSACVITLPSNFTMQANPQWDDGTKEFTAALAETYNWEFTFDGTNWHLN